MSDEPAEQDPRLVRRQLLQPGAMPGLYVQAFVPYGSASKTAALPIPASLRPSAVAFAPNVSYPDVAASALFGFAGGATTYFGLRFLGECQPALTVHQTLSFSAALA